MTEVYAPDLYPAKRRRHSGHNEERDKFIRETYGVDPAVLADTMNVTPGFIVQYQRSLGLRKLSSSYHREPADIVNKLKEIRKAKNIPLEQVAEQINCNFRTMRYWEAGSRNPIPMWLERWADALGYQLVLRPK